jgi:hypothetical protein
VFFVRSLPGPLKQILPSAVAISRHNEDINVPTNLPTNPEQNYCNFTGLGADAWVGIVVVLALFIVGAIYWSGHAGEANATSAPPSQAAGSDH